MTPTTLAGPAACLSAALLWAVAVTLFRAPIGEHGARTINLVKCVLAAVLQGATVLALGRVSPLFGASTEAVVLIVASGLVGLVLGDTALFGAVARIGVYRTLLLQTLAPVFTAAIAFLWQGERLSGRQLLGALLILGGVALVLSPRRPAAPAAASRGLPWSIGGIGIGVLAAFGQGSGVVLAKAGMHEIPALPASFLRLAAAAVGLAALGLIGGRLGRVPGLLKSAKTMARVVPATLLGTYLALFLMMGGVALAPASVAAVLLSTSPVFGIVLERVVDGTPITWTGLGGTALAVAGVGLLTAA